jgi:hypothetical protein
MLLHAAVVMAADSAESLTATGPADGMPDAVEPARRKTIDDQAAEAEVEPVSIAGEYAGASAGRGGGEESRAMRDLSGKQKAMAA